MSPRRRRDVPVHDFKGIRLDAASTVVHKLGWVRATGRLIAAAAWAACATRPAAMRIRAARRSETFVEDDRRRRLRVKLEQSAGAPTFTDPGRSRSGQLRDSARRRRVRRRLQARRTDARMSFGMQVGTALRAGDPDRLHRAGRSPTRRSSASRASGASQRSKTCRSLFQRKFFYLFTCEYCFSHYVTLGILVLTRYHLWLPDWRGYVLAGFSLVFIANVYMSAFGELRLEIRQDRQDIAIDGKEIEQDADGAKAGAKSSVPHRVCERRRGSSNEPPVRLDDLSRQLDEATRPRRAAWWPVSTCGSLSLGEAGPERLVGSRVPGPPEYHDRRLPARLRQGIGSASRHRVRPGNLRKGLIGWVLAWSIEPPYRLKIQDRGEVRARTGALR